MRVNNRKLAEGFYRGLGIEDPVAVLRSVDKLDKIGADRGRRSCSSTTPASPRRRPRRAWRSPTISAADESFVDQVRALGVAHPLLDEGLRAAGRGRRGPRGAYAPGRLVADLKIARGLDYYTGTVYETVLVGYESFGSICSGGRYDSLASRRQDDLPGRRAVHRRLPAAGPAARREALLRASRSVPTRRARRGRRRGDRGTRRRGRRARCGAAGIATEVAPNAAKFGKQIRYADRRGIPYVWFPVADGEGRGQGHPLRRPDPSRRGDLGAARGRPETKRPSVLGRS